ncbi:unnamed protein product, partial [Mesorhabditis spiculigera]
MGWEPPGRYLWHLLPLLLALALRATPIDAVICTQCPYSPEPPHLNDCQDECHGDVCYIVVNKYFNGTIIAGCLKLREGDRFLGKNVCHREETRTICGCDGRDHCNHPQTPLATFEFVDEPVFAKFETIPQLQSAAASNESTVAPKKVETTTEKIVEVQSSMFVKDVESKIDTSTSAPLLRTISPEGGNNITELAEIQKPSATRLTSPSPILEDTEETEEIQGPQEKPAMSMMSLARRKGK